MGLLRAGQLPKKVVAYAVDILPLFATAYAFEQGIFAERMSGEEAAATWRSSTSTGARCPPTASPTSTRSSTR